MTYSLISVSSQKDYEEIIKKTFLDIQSPNPLIGLCGGGSIKPVLKSLYSLARADDTSASKATYLLADERMVPLSSEESNGKLVIDSLVRPLKKKNIEISFFPFNTEKPDEGQKRYSEIIAHHSSFDILFLGMGPDAHIASIFPNGEWLNTPKEAFMFQEKNSPKPPAHRASISPRCIFDAKCIVLLFSGEGKAAPLDAFLEAEASPTETPIMLTHLAPQVLALADDACLDASRLGREKLS